MPRVAARRESLRHALNTYRAEANAAMQSRIRHERADTSSGVGDLLEQTDANYQSSLEFAVVQMRADTIGRIDEALARLDAGQYGSCIACRAEISESRLRALPFAVRCRDCAERDEQQPSKQGPFLPLDLDWLSPLAKTVGP